MPKLKDDEITRLSVVLPKAMHEQVLNMAKEYDLSIAWVIRYIIADFIKNDLKITIGSKK